MKHTEEIMYDHRQERRFLLDAGGILAKLGPAKGVELVNISMSGICIRTDKWLKIGNEYHLHLKDSRRAISLFGAIKWSFLDVYRPGSSKEPASGIPIYTSGVQFTECSKEGKEALSALIADHLKRGRRPLEGKGAGPLFYLREVHGVEQSPVHDQSISTGGPAAQGHCEITAESVAMGMQELTADAVGECSRKDSRYYIGDFT